MNAIKKYYKEVFKKQSLVSKGEEFKPNRKERRSSIKRFRGNNKGFSLSISGPHKYSRECQSVRMENGSIKVINHYVLRSRI